ncbi:signal peptide containing protein, partial [Theileria equi strain WA]
MKILAALWAVSLVRLCHCGEQNSLRREVADVSLDLLNPNEGSVHVAGDDKDGVTKRVFTPKDGFALTKVLTGEVEVWKVKAGERCTLVEAYSKGDSMLIYLKVESATGLDLKYLEGVNGTWKDVTITEFYHRLEEMRKDGEKSPEEEMEKHLERAKRRLEGSESASPVAESSGNTNASGKISAPIIPSPDHVDGTPITLDLANPDQSKVHIGDRSGNGVNSKKYYPKDGYDIGSVTDGDKELWKSTGAGQKCCFARSYTRGDSSLISIGISKG